MKPKFAPPSRTSSDAAPRLCGDWRGHLGLLAAWAQLECDDGQVRGRLATGGFLYDIRATTESGVARGTLRETVSTRAFAVTLTRDGDQLRLFIDTEEQATERGPLVLAFERVASPSTAAVQASP